MQQASGVELHIVIHRNAPSYMVFGNLVTWFWRKHTHISIDVEVESVPKHGADTKHPGKHTHLQVIA
jgi:hypothetical protein